MAAATLIASLHRRPLPARQGDRPGRRGGLADPDGDRLQADRDRRGRPAHHAARDRAPVAGRGRRSRHASPAASSSSARWPRSASARTPCTPSGSVRRRRSARWPTLQEKLEQARTDLERAQREADLGRAAELQYGTIPELEKQLAEAEQAGGEDAAAAVSSRTWSTPRTSPRSSPSGRGSRSPA